MILKNVYTIIQNLYKVYYTDYTLNIKLITFPSVIP